MVTWKMYIEELFWGHQGHRSEKNCKTGVTILESEVNKALEQSKNGKLLADIMKVLGALRS